LTGLFIVPKKMVGRAHTRHNTRFALFSRA
jgi:hypothetical protein